MTFDLLLRMAGFLFHTKQRSSVARSEEAEDDQPCDPENPFPDLVAIEFRDVLDLHSIPARQVRAVVEDYLAEAHLRDVTGLRIIHGKGVGVQRDIVRSVLSKLPYVIEYRDAPPEAGGWGATVVTLGKSS